jgi:hypothetical protein
MRDDFTEGASMHEFHGDGVHAAMRTDLVDGDDVGVLQLGGELRFLHESAASLRVGRAVGM